MIQRHGMIDVAADLMHDIKKMDASRDERTLARRDSVTATLMREVGFSDQEISAKLGYLPGPLEDAVRERSRSGSSRMSQG